MKEAYLHNPSFLELDDAYRGLSFLNSILIKSSQLEHTLSDLEKIGFVGIDIISYQDEASAQMIRAYKGKHGPCYFTGEKAGYTGSALAALDDDNHILHSNTLLEVCDKTFRILGLPAYQGLINSENELREIQQKNSSDADQLDDFESIQASLYDQLRNITRRLEKRQTLFYPGPFRMLILEDGSMVYRGKWCSVPMELSRDLIDRDRCIESKEDQKGHLSYFQEEYKEHGSAALLQGFKPEITSQPIFESDFSMLRHISKKLKDRLLNLIDKQKKYFLLIGNEAEDQLGCCPSEEVTEANQLVKNGILSSLAEPIQGDSCPVTMYAFKDELSISSNGFNCQINEEFRGRVHRELIKSSGPVMMNILKWVLLAFIIISLGLAARKCEGLRNTTSSESIYQKLSPSPDAPFIVVLFHNQKRCYQCLEIEKNTATLLTEHFQNELDMDHIAFKTVVIDDPSNIGIVELFGIFAPTLVLMEFDQKELIKSKVLLDVTELYRDEQAFKDQMEQELNQFMIAEDG